MTTIKSYTDISQSKKLAEILPHESADMFYKAGNDTQPTFRLCSYGHIMSNTDVYAWSIAALLGVLPKIGAEEPMVRKLYYASKPVERYICEYGLTNMTSEYDNPVDACVAMIERLHELNLL